MRSLQEMPLSRRLALGVVQGALVIGLLALVLFAAAGTLD